MKNQLYSTWLMIAIMFATLTVFTSCGKDNGDEPQIPIEETVDGDAGRTLIVYFSWGRNTETVANEIHSIIGGDIVQIEPVEPYPDSYEEVRPIAYSEIENGAREIKTVVANMDDYDTLIVGSPIWGGHLTPIVKRFLDSYNLEGKNIAPFTTHQGSGLGSSVADIRSVCPYSTILSGLAINASHVKSSHTEIENWLKQIGVVK